MVLVVFSQTVKGNRKLELYTTYNVCVAVKLEYKMKNTYFLHRIFVKNVDMTPLNRTHSLWTQIKESCLALEYQQVFTN